MSREPSPKRYQALRIWIKSGRTKKPKQIADELGISPNLVRKWKSIDRWDDIPDKPNKRGAPYRNKNAVGNKGGPGGPIGNDKAVKHGLFRKFLPDDPETMEIFDASEEISPLDILWTSIRILWTNIIRAQKIMFVSDKEDETRVLKKQKRQLDSEKIGKGEDQRVETFEVYVEEEWEIQHAWDKQGRALATQAAAMRTLANKIKQYEEMIRQLPPDEVLAEQRLRVDKLKSEIKNLNTKGW